MTSEDSNVVGTWEFPSDSLTLGNSSTEARSTISDDPEHALEYGGYYNFCAASAGTICNNTTVQDAVQDICPKGWRLPTGGTSSEMADISRYVSAFPPVLSGAYANGVPNYIGSFGNWWSATVSGNNGIGQFTLFYNGYSFDHLSSLARLHGLSVRCIRSNPGTLTINFDDNGSDGGSTASQQIAAGNTASLNTNGFTRNGYAFTGWNTAADGSGTSYADGADYTVTPATGDISVTLYAQWAPSMQDFTLTQCQSLASDANYTVVDSRDGSDYTVRYINGACWMTQNLRLPGGTMLTTSDSNVTRNYTLPNSSTSGFNSYTVANMYNGTDTTYGAYYNYCAASAGTVCSQTQANATQDICPRGWRLPTLNEMDGIRSYRSAFSPVYSGYYNSGSLYATGSNGYWWSATAINSSNQYYMYYRSGSLYTDISGLYKYGGFSVRCIRSS